MTTDQNNPDITPVTDITTLPPAARAVIVLSSTKTEADLKALVETASTITEVKDKAGREQAHSIGMKLKNARITIEKTGKTAREDAQAFSAAVIAEEKRLKAITAAEEERVFKLRDGWDAEQRRIQEEAARRAAEAQRKEEARKAEIREKIEGVRRLPAEMVNATSSAIMDERIALDAFVPNPEVLQEFMQEMVDALAETSVALETLYNTVKAREDAAVQFEVERRAVEQRAAAAEAEAAALRAQLAALQAQQKPPVVPAGAETAPVEPTEEVTLRVPAEVAQAVEENPEGAQQALIDGIEVTEIVTPGAPEVREYALATADQFNALASKVELCGFGAFATELRAVGVAVVNGDHDARLAAVDKDLLLACDYNMQDATDTAIRSINSAEAA